MTQYSSQQDVIRKIEYFLSTLLATIVDIFFLVLYYVIFVMSFWFLLKYSSLYQTIIILHIQRRKSLTCTQLWTWITIFKLHHYIHVELIHCVAMYMYVYMYVQCTCIVKHNKTLTSEESFLEPLSFDMLLYVMW